VKTCLVQLGRYGDILNLLPVAHAIAKEEGGKVAMLVHREFMDLMEGVSYVEAVRWEGDMMQPHTAAVTLNGKFERVIVAQVADSSRARQRVCEAFNMDQWHNCGFLDRWSDPELKLVIDRRSHEREHKLMESLRLRGRPYILVNTRGISGKFHAEDQLLTELQTRWVNEAVVVDMRRFKAAKIFDLLGLIDNAICLVTVDTSTLHLAAASKTPTIALLRDYADSPTGRTTDLWCGPKLRGGNIVLSMRYGEYQHRRNEINAAVQRAISHHQKVITGRLELPVTIIGVDNFTPARTLQALWFSQRMVQVPEVVLICKPGNQLPGGDHRGVRIKPIIQGGNRADREKFLTCELHKHFETSHCLHVEWDARIANPAAWNPEWLQYDYIGAPWPWPFDQCSIPWAPHIKALPPCTKDNCVGNLGFALLSKRFAQAVSSLTDPNDDMAAMSDIYMCRVLRPKLEAMGIRFAPEGVAAAFSCEGRYFCSNFGWHGQGTAAMNGFKLL
jgi:hypothetical protein